MRSLNMFLKEESSLTNKKTIYSPTLLLVLDNTPYKKAHRLAR